MASSGLGSLPVLHGQWTYCLGGTVVKQLSFLHFISIPPLFLKLFKSALAFEKPHNTKINSLFYELNNKMIKIMWNLF